MKTTLAGAGCLTLLVALGNAQALPLPAAAPRIESRFCTPGRTSWPSAAEWQRLAHSLTGTLQEPKSPLLPCSMDSAGAACKAAIEEMKNPFLVQDQPGGTESAGWLDAWTAAPGAYLVTAKNSQDVVVTVNFARAHNMRLVIRGTGHDYLGRSNAPDSLVLWTHEMRTVTMSDAFMPTGCASAPASPAVTIDAGTRWFEVNQEVMVRHNRYVQGGGCLSVGAAGGFTQGGGFGIWSKKFGTTAGNMLQAEVVTADGQLRVVNACQDPDLFWALRGGGGGTFGVVTKVTLRTDSLPSYFGATLGTVQAKTDAAFKELLERFVRFYRERLSNESWGGTVDVRQNNSLRVGMLFQGMSAAQAERAWQPMRTFAEQHPDKFTIGLHFVEAPGNKLWDLKWLQEHVPGAVTIDTSNRAWWSDNQGEVGTYWYAYQSRYLPLANFAADAAKPLAATLFAASRYWHLELHFHKGEAGASAEARARDRQTAINPAVFESAGLLIAASDGKGHPGIRDREPDRAEGEHNRAQVTAAMKIIRDATPGAGSYANEADFFEANWQQEFWGKNYPRLLAIKRKYDPVGLFYCHHCVGSEAAGAQ